MKRRERKKERREAGGRERRIEIKRGGGKTRRVERRELQRREVGEKRRKGYDDVDDQDTSLTNADGRSHEFNFSNPLYCTVGHKFILLYSSIFNSL